MLAPGAMTTTERSAASGAASDRRPSDTGPMRPPSAPVMTQVAGSVSLRTSAWLMSLFGAGGTQDGPATASAGAFDQTVQRELGGANTNRGHGPEPVRFFGDQVLYG